MQQQTPFYPVRVVSRSVGRKSAKRMGWFALGTGFGVGCALFLSTTLSSNSLPFSWNVANQAPNLSLSLVEKQVAELSEAQGINVVALALPPNSVKPKDIVLSPQEREPQIIASSLSPVSPAVEAPLSAEALEQADAAAKPVELVGASDQTLAVAPVAKEQEVASASAPRPAPNMYPLMLDLKVGNGDTLINILTDTGVSYQEAHNAIDSIRTYYDPKKLDIGQSVSVTLNKEDTQDFPMITSMNVPISNISSVQVVRDNNDEVAHFSAREIKEKLYQKPAHVGGKIQGSLYETGMKKGIPASILNEIINAYSYDVDFQRDIHAGDSIDVLFERMQTKEGDVGGIGKLLYANLVLDGKPMKFFRYVDKSGNVDYYNEKGESIRKALLRTPMNGAKITSGFGMRSHPLLGYSKMHRGVDFGAPTGTPIYAAGDGVVSFASRKGGYGNYLVLQHDKKYGSAYGHISRFASGMSVGKKVKQGQIVAYVGSTGMSTGPHLHYEILVNGSQVNPAGVKFKTGNIIGGKDLIAFKKNVTQVLALLSEPQDKKQKLALNK